MPAPASPRTDPLRALRAFAQVVRLGSVSRAAEALGVSQPAVTLQLQALAREHGVVLLERGGRRLVPTPAGEALLALARPLVDGMDGLPQALRELLDARTGATLAIAAGGVALARLLPPALAGWAPGAGLRIEHAPSDRALAQLRAGEVALALGSWLDVPGDIEVLPLVRSPACLLAAPGHPAAGLSLPGPLALSAHALVVPRERRTTRQLVDLAFARAGAPLPPLREAGDWSAVHALVALGQGVAVTPRLAVPARPPDGLVAMPLPEAFPARPYGIAVRRGRQRSAPVEALIERLREASTALG